MGAFRPTFQQLFKGRRGWRVNAPILGVIFYPRNPGRDSIDQKEDRMSGTEDKPIPGEPPQSSDLEKPKAAHWLWRPWYAKSWWTAAAIFWLIAFFAPNLFLNTNHVAPLILLFHPFLMVPALGFGFFRTWFRHHSSSSESSGISAGHLDANARHDREFRRMDPTNPANSRYYAHPGNPTSTEWLDKHVRGKH